MLDLHDGLSRLGVEVRTVALGPGRTGGLDAVVPTLAPATGSLAAVTQLRREQRWADTVVCADERAAAVQRRTLGRGLVVLRVTGGAKAADPVAGDEALVDRSGHKVADNALTMAPDAWERVLRDHPGN